jgi:hypothetical protein
MLHSKDINKIWELKNGFTQRWLEPDFIFSSLKFFTFSNLCKVVSEVKVKGYSFEWIMTILLSMPFLDANTVNSMLNGCIKHQIEAGKDTFYRIKNSQSICWRMLLWLFAAKFKALTNNCLENPEDFLMHIAGLIVSEIEDPKQAEHLIINEGTRLPKAACDERIKRWRLMCFNKCFYFFRNLLRVPLWALEALIFPPPQVTPDLRVLNGESFIPHPL